MTKVEESLGLISVARGTGKADLYIGGGNLVNVLSGEIYPANVAVWNGRIAYVGLSRKMAGSNTRVIDTGGYYLCPGLIEAHFHPWFVYNPVSIMEVALASGTTTMLCDNLILYINLGAERFLKILKALDNYPLRLLWTARVMSHSPYPGEEEFFSIENLRKVFFDPHILKVGEFTQWRKLIEGDNNLVEGLDNFSPHFVFSRGELAAVDGKLTKSINEREGYLERQDDLLYCTLIDRCSKWITNGFVSGLGQFEALATTLSSSLNLFVVGQDFSAMARAASKVVEMGGGIALIEKGEISYSFPLKLAGVMSTQSFAEAAAKIQEFDEKASALGYKYNDICYTLLFLACDFLPFLRITGLGIINIKNKRTIIPSRKIKINPGE